MNRDKQAHVFTSRRRQTRPARSTHRLFVAFGYTHDAEQDAFHKPTGRIIKVLTVQEVLDEEFVQKM